MKIEIKIHLQRNQNPLILGFDFSPSVIIHLYFCIFFYSYPHLPDVLYYNLGYNQ